MGGVAPIREPAAGAPGAAEEEDAAAAEGPWIELRSARGARGGAFPDIDGHGEVGRGGNEGEGGWTWFRWWSWVKRHRPRDFALGATSWAAVALFRPSTSPFAVFFARFTHEIRTRSYSAFFPLLLLAHMENARHRTTCRKTA